MTLEITRFEHKYQLTMLQYLQLKSALVGRCRLDHYSRLTPSHRYYVRSLYYDTSDYRAYYEKMDGVYFRKKLRLRTYWENPSEAKFINAEIKMKIGDQTTKRTAHLSMEQYRDFESKHPHTNLPSVAQDFRRIIMAEGLRPSILIDYQREVWEPIESSPLRISVDFNIRSGLVQEIYAPVRWAENHIATCVLEIKSALSLPGWLQQTVQQLGLGKQSNSKYANGLHHSILCYHAI